MIIFTASDTCIPATRYKIDGCTPSVLHAGISSSFSSGNMHRRHADLFGKIVQTEPVTPIAPA